MKIRVTGCYHRGVDLRGKSPHRDPEEPAVTDDQLANNVDWLRPSLPMPPEHYSSMDARLTSASRMLGIKEGVRHVIRNAGRGHRRCDPFTAHHQPRLLGTRRNRPAPHRGLTSSPTTTFKCAIQTRPASDPRGSPESYPRRRRGRPLSPAAHRGQPVQYQRVVFGVATRQTLNEVSSLAKARAVSLGRTGAPAACRDGPC